MMFYLAGAIEYSPDHGRAWRAELTPFLQSLGHAVYDPAQDELKNLSAEEAMHFRAWKTTDLSRFQQTLRKIIEWDLDWIEKRCDAVICYWDQHAQRGAGTQAELTLAHRRGLPVHLVSAMPIEEISGWILGCASHLYPDVDTLRAQLTSAAHATTKMAEASA